MLGNASLFLDSETAGRCLARAKEGGFAAHAKVMATRARHRRQLFGAWDGATYRYPAFQFDPSQRAPRPEVPALVEVLPRDHDGSGRDAALWLFAPDAALDGQTPAVMFLENPKRVIALARARRDGGPACD